MSRAKNTIEQSPFLNRELSWLAFNQRVLEEALDPEVPLLERLKFFCIFSSNLDEFFEVRVAGLKQQVESQISSRGPDGLTPSACLRAIQRRVRQLVATQYRCWREDLVPALARHGIRFLEWVELNEEDRAWLERYYHQEVRQILTPLAIDPAHPFPQLANKSLNMMVQLEMTRGSELLRHLAVVQVPRGLPRLVRLPHEEGRHHYVFLGRLIGHFLQDLFPGTTILGYWMFRLTRNSELYIDEEEAENLLEAVENELHNRRKGDAVRLEVDRHCPAEIRQALLGTLLLSEDDLYEIEGPLNPGRLMAVYEGDHSPELRDALFVAPSSVVMRQQPDLFAALRAGDLLLHHPYESFETVVRFLETAAEDPRVLAIKQTLYRTGGDERIIGALMHAVRNGKQVTAVVELRARFDEANNIRWSRRLEENGVHVVYGLVGYKIHGKMALVVRRDEDGLRRYIHLGTGNYNPSTAKIYTDLSLLTSRPAMGEDVTNLFNLLTGVCQFSGMQRLLVAPFDLHRRVLQLIEREAEHVRRGLPARIIAKMNALVDGDVIQALYRASQAGVRVDLVVRGICCLRPGVPGLSENISVRSIVDRFLEHSRILYFENACRPEVFVGSADWMLRNFHRRIEVVFPIEDGNLRERLIGEILALPLADNVKAKLLQSDGSYHRIAPDGTPPCRSQSEFLRRSLAAGQKARARSAPAERYPRVRLRPRPPEAPEKKALAKPRRARTE
jgi:polyphosphate kinase